MDPAGAAVAGAEVWAVGGDWEHPRLANRATTDDRGRFVLAGAWKPRGAEGIRTSASWLAPRTVGWDGRAPSGPEMRGGRRRPASRSGRSARSGATFNDQDGRPIAGAEVTPVNISRKHGDPPGQDYIRIPPELAGPFKATTAADGSFAIRGIPRDTEVQATDRRARLRRAAGLVG